MVVIIPYEVKVYTHIQKCNGNRSMYGAYVKHCNPYFL